MSLNNAEVLKDGADGAGKGGADGEGKNLHQIVCVRCKSKILPPSMGTLTVSTQLTLVLKLL